MAQADVENNGKRKREDESDFSCDDESNDSDVTLLSGFKSKKVAKRIDGFTLLSNAKVELTSGNRRNFQIFCITWI